MPKLWRDRLYYKVRRKEVNSSIRRLKKIKTGTILQCISKECWKSNIQYKVIIKNYDILLLYTMGTRKSILIMYHKTNKVNSEQLQNFEDCMTYYSVDRGVYIALGSFQEKYKLHRKTKLVNGIAFVRFQIGFFRKTYKQISFYKFLPD